MDAQKEIEQLATDFEQCRKVLIALGDENRQHMILEMMKMKDCYGVCVNDISKRHIYLDRLYLIITDLKTSRHLEYAKGRNKKLLLF